MSLTFEVVSYEAANLKPGAYKMNISFAGFKAVEVLNVAVRGSEIIRADAKLEPTETPRHKVLGVLVS